MVGDLGPVRNFISWLREDSVEESADYIQNNRTFVPETTSELAELTSTLFEAGKRGLAQLLFARFLDSHPHSNESSLLLLDMRARSGPTIDGSLEKAMESFRPQSYDECLRLASLWGRIDNTRSGQALEQAIRMDPQRIEARERLISYLRSNNQLRRCRRELDALLKYVPDTPRSLAFVVEQAVYANDIALFRRLLPQAEAAVTSSDDVPATMLARAYTFLRQRKNLTRILDRWRVADIKADWLLKELLAISERMGLATLRRSVAIQIIKLHLKDAALLAQAQDVLRCDDLLNSLVGR